MELKFYILFSLFLFLKLMHLSSTSDLIRNTEENTGYHGNVTFDQELLLTKEEKIAFDKFKAAVYSKISHPFFKQDIYLLRWIRAKYLNVNIAVQEMFQFLDYLDRNNISDNILQEDWADMREEHPFSVDIEDRQGRPVVYGSPGDGWNIRKTILQGKQSRFIRYTYYFVWNLIRRFMEINKTNPNVTQLLILMNMEGFNVIQHSCANCITSYIQMLDIFDRYVPGYVKEIIVINAPQAYLVMLQVLKPGLSKQTRNALNVFNTDKRKWKPYIISKIDPSKLPTSFGGTRQEN